MEAGKGISGRARTRGERRLFHGACLVGLFERAGYYTLLSFAVVYLGQLGFGRTWPGILVGGGLGLLVYALQAVSGALADRAGFRPAILAGASLLLAGFAAFGAPVWLGGRALERVVRPEVTVGPWEVAAVLAGILLVAAGRSLMTPACAGLVRQGAGPEPVVAFGTFFALGNLGQVAGLALCWLLRRGTELGPVFAVAAGSAAAALAAALFLPRPAPSGPLRVRRSAPLLADLAALARNPRFVRFTLAAAGFFTLLGQVWILLPLYLKTVVQVDPALDLYVLVVPAVAVTCQPAVSRISRHLRPIASIALGTCVLSLGMLANLPPLFPEEGPRAALGTLRAGALGAVLTMACASLGGLWVVPRVYEHLGALAPPGREGLYLGMASLTMALGHLVSGLLGPALLQGILLRGALERPDGLLDPEPRAAALSWVLLAGLGLGSALAMWLALPAGPARERGSGARA
jgi:dipeptide/tripeptide permease